MTEKILNTTTDTLETTSAREAILNVGTAVVQGVHWALNQSERSIFFQPIREPHMAHVTIWPRGHFSGPGTEGNALRAGFGGVA